MSEFKRTRDEDYGPSIIRLEKLDMSKMFAHIEVDDLEVILPVLNLKKYDENAECYALIETLQNNPITMIDILYSYEDILDRFEHNERFREEFFNAYTRRQINISSLISPALTMIPKKEDIAKRFANALKQSLQDSMGTQIKGISKIKKEKVKVEEKPSGPIEEDGIVLEFIKGFYEIISGTKVKRPTDVQKKTINCALKKEAILMKSGAMIVDSEVVDKYFATFQTEVTAEDIQSAKDTLAVYISGINETLLMTSPEYLKNFGNVLLSSNILEVFAYLNANKFPKMNYIGRYNEEEARMEVYKKIEKYFRQLNQILVPPKEDRDR